MKDRVAFGYVVSVDGAMVTLNLNDDHRGQVAAHRGGVTSVTDVASVFGVNAGDRLMVMRTRSVAFNEPREAHRAGVGPGPAASPLRNVAATAIGIIRRRDGACTFVADCLSSPPLGAEAFPLNDDELGTLLRRDADGLPGVRLGLTVRGGGELVVGVQDLLSRHVAVLGSTGQGKSCFTAAVVQQLLKLPRPRIVVFDVNGEYAEALEAHASGGQFKRTVLGDGMKIPYYALGRPGLSRLLLPSEKTQRPALNFALEKLDHVKTYATRGGAGLGDSVAPVFFDDCRPAGADVALVAMTKLREGNAPAVDVWPHMRALACLVAESHTLRQGKNPGTAERTAWEYGNVAPLVTRILRCIEDPQFCRVISVEGGAPHSGSGLDWRQEARALVEAIFGGPTESWKVHVVDLRHVAHDLMPHVLGSLLELFAFELFERGPGATYPTSLVLEEAHHYLRSPRDDDSTGSGLAYERLAKEGRKFGLSLWISTQRPSEVSPTVLAQCGTWVAFRLSGDADLKAVQSAAEWVDRHEVSQIPGLPRQHALVFGSAVIVPTRVIAVDAFPIPKSSDPQFERWLAIPPEPSTVAAAGVVAPEQGAREDASDDDIPF